MTARRTYGIGFLGGVSAVLVWKLVEALWPSLGWWIVVVPIGLFALLNIAELIRYWLAGRRGLEQWPEPHGRYYDEWMSLPADAGDYYDWLCRRMGGGEPWASWARAHRTRSAG